tara:strand:- start:1252 stop:1647 length:396 start_codon:yes stop_codon:yes gene_type:complete
MKKLLVLLILIVGIFTSCGTYNISTSYKIKSILTITEKGDTLAVPVRDFKFRILRQENPFGYQYRQDWQYKNWNNYYIPNINVRDTYSPPVMHTRPVTVPIIKPVKSIKIVTPVAIPSIKVINSYPSSKKN